MSSFECMLIASSVVAVATRASPSPRAADDGPRTALVQAIAGEQDDYCAAVVRAENEFLVSGYTRRSTGADDALLLRVDPQGQELWRRVVPGGGQAALWSVCALEDGGCVAAGWTKSARGDLDATLVRFDRAGSVLWQRTYGAERDERLWSLELLPDGLLAAGESASPSGSPAGTRGLVIRTDLDGHERFLRTPGDAQVERLFAVQSLSDGAYATAGMSGHGPRESAGYDARIACYDAAGARKWERVWGGPDFDVAHDLKRLPDGSLMAVGYTTAGAGRGTDAFALQLSPTGELASAWTYGGPRDDRAVHLELLGSGGFAFVGYSQNEDASWDMIVRAADAHGALTWTRRFGGAGDELGRALASTATGGLVVVGQSRSYGPRERILLVRLEALPG